MKKTLLLFIALLGMALANGQGKKNIRIGLFTSLYLDSAFDQSGQYKLQNSFPRMAISGLEFYEGAVMAIDSINQAGPKVSMEVFDIQSKTGSIAYLLNNKKIDSLDIIIAQTGGSDYLELAQIAKEKNIPMVSATYPNDGGIRESPMLFIANPKINSHIQVIHNQLFKKWPDANVIWFKRIGSADDKIESQFRELNAASVYRNKFKTAALKYEFKMEDLVPFMDTTKTNVLIAGSLDDNFALQFARAIADYPKKGIIQVIGMPGWDGMKEIQGKNYAGMPIYFTTSFNIPPGHQWAAKVDEKVKSITGVKPSISLLKGFELTYYFANVLSKYGEIRIDTPEAKPFKVLNDFDFRPVKWSPMSKVPDYYENKRIYFIRRLNGVSTVQ
jgi:ABC-type branched-subunit amino acid transport system substrate-binding protein